MAKGPLQLPLVVVVVVVVVEEQQQELVQVVVVGLEVVAAWGLDLASAWLVFLEQVPVSLQTCCASS